MPKPIVSTKKSLLLLSYTYTVQFHISCHFLPKKDLFKFHQLIVGLRGFNERYQFSKQEFSEFHWNSLLRLIFFFVFSVMSCTTLSVPTPFNYTSAFPPKRNEISHFSFLVANLSPPTFLAQSLLSHPAVLGGRKRLNFECRLQRQTTGALLQVPHQPRVNYSTLQ